jgi:ferric-dicitrate binding protein FerR (iron transport regulator)
MRGDPAVGQQPDFDTLALMHLDGVLDQTQHAEFERMLRADPQAAMRLATLAELHASLSELGRTTLARQTTKPASSTTTRTHRRVRRSGFRFGRHRVLPWGLAAAAILVIAVTLALTQPHAGDRITVTDGTVVIERGSTHLRVTNSADLRPQDTVIVAANTRARITTSANDKLDLRGGSRLQWADGVNVELDAGMFTADITPRPATAPFLVRTPRADLTIIGTRFTVQADDGLSLLAVDHGRVRLSNRDDAHQVDVAAQQMSATTGTGQLAAATGSLPTLATTGLTGDYFDNQDFTGWRLRRIDPAIDFNWDKDGPDPLVGPETFSVRWRGWLVPTYSGPCTFTVLMDDGVRLWLDGRLVLDEWHLNEKVEFSTTVTLEAGRAYQVRLDYYQEPTDALIRWYWSGGDYPKQPVPTSWLRPVDWTPPAR